MECTGAYEFGRCIGQVISNCQVEISGKSARKVFIFSIYIIKKVQLVSQAVLSSPSPLTRCMIASASVFKI